MAPTSIFFRLAAVGLIAGALTHLGALYTGPGAIAYLGAPAVIVQSAARGTWLAPVTIWAIALLLLGLAALCERQARAQPPQNKTPQNLTRAILWLWASIFLIRGFITFFVLFSLDYTQLFTWISLISSFTVLIIALLMTWGLLQSRAAKAP